MLKNLLTWLVCAFLRLLLTSLNVPFDHLNTSRILVSSTPSPPRAYMRSLCTRSVQLDPKVAKRLFNEISVVRACTIPREHAERRHQKKVYLSLLLRNLNSYNCTPPPRILFFVVTCLINPLACFSQIFTSHATFFYSPALERTVYLSKLVFKLFVFLNL